MQCEIARLRDEATRMRLVAVVSGDPVTALRLIRGAEDTDRLADRIEAGRIKPH